eukprot:365907-Chlamydomonas_euryale.AAC.28
MLSKRAPAGGGCSVRSITEAPPSPRPSPPRPPYASAFLAGMRMRPPAASTQLPNSSDEVRFANAPLSCARLSSSTCMALRKSVARMPSWRYASTWAAAHSSTKQDAALNSGTHALVAACQHVGCGIQW